MFGYVHLLCAAGDILAFGFVLTFLASFGQTFFIALFATEVRQSFGLSHGGFGGIFSAATLASGFLLIWAGGLIDRMPAGAYATIAMLGLAAAALLFGLAPHVAVLGLAVFFLRLTGQGMLSHAAATTMARLDAPVRGKALSIAQLGHPTGQAVFPALVLASIALLGWRPTWALAGICAGVTAALLVVARRRRLDRRLLEALPPDRSSSAGGHRGPRHGLRADHQDRADDRREPRPAGHRRPPCTIRGFGRASASSCSSGIRARSSPGWTRSSAPARSAWASTCPTCGW